MRFVALLFFLTLFNQSFSQKRDVRPFDKFVSKIDKLKDKEVLNEVVYSEGKTCGGSLRGYYLQDKLVLMIAENRGEYGMILNRYYVLNSKILKIVNVEKYSAGRVVKGVKNKDSKFIEEKKELYFFEEVFEKKHHKKDKIKTYSNESIVECGEYMIKLLNNRDRLD